MDSNDRRRANESYTFRYLHFKNSKLFKLFILSIIGFHHRGSWANAALTASYIGNHCTKMGVGWIRKDLAVSNTNLEKRQLMANKYRSRFIATPLQNESWNEGLARCQEAFLTSGDNLKRVPLHVGIVLDGNGRWARQRNLPVSLAHMAGADRVLQLIPFLQSSGIKCCTLYCLSTENWSRPEQEVMNIFSILEQTLISVMDSDTSRGIQVKLLGSREELPCSLLNVLDQIESSTQNENHNSDLTICLAINYGGRRDIVDATKKIIQAVQNGEISDPSTQVTETSFSSYLSTKELPELDLIIRTGGDQRLSNFLLWNAAYAELYFTDVLWPDFNEKYLTEALEWYSRRDRRFGGRKTCRK